MLLQVELSKGAGAANCHASVVAEPLILFLTSNLGDNLGV